MSDSSMRALITVVSVVLLGTGTYDVLGVAEGAEALQPLRRGHRLHPPGQDTLQ